MRDKSYRCTRFACYLGSVIQAVTVSVPPVLFVLFQDFYKVRYEELGILIFLTFALQIGVDYALSKLSGRIGTRLLMILCGSFNAVGYALLALSPILFPDRVFYGLLLAVLFYSTASGIIEVMTSPIVNAIPSKDQSASMAFLHSAFCWGELAAVLVTTLLLHFLGRERWQFILLFWLILPALFIYLFAVSPLPELQSGHEKGGPKLWRLSLFWFALILMIASGASEQAMAQWASLFAQKGLHITKTLGDLAGPCFFALLMGLGRVYYGIRGERMNMKRALILSACLCIISYLLAVFSPHPALSLLGLGLCGLSVSLMWPGTLMLSSRRVEGGGTQLFALLAMGGDIGCALGPYLTGLISGRMLDLSVKAGTLDAEETALRGGLLSAVLFPLLMILFVVLLTRVKTPEALEKRKKGV